MNRQEAISLLKEISEKCDGLFAEGIMLMPPDADDVLSHGYRLHLTASFGDEHLMCIKPIVEEHGLAMANVPEKKLLVIYRPMKNSSKR